MSSISGLGSSMMASSMYSSQNTQQKQGPPPPGENLEETFDLLDTDESGDVSASELAAMTDQMSEMSGISISSTDSMTEFDSNGDSLLSQDEMGSLMSSLHETLGPPPQDGGMNQQQVSSIYAANQDEATSLTDLLSTDDDDDESVDLLTTILENQASNTSAESVEDEFLASF